MKTITTNQPLTAEFVLTPDLPRWAEAFVMAKKAEGLARKTITGAYSQSLRAFLAWCEKRSVLAWRA